MLLQTLHQRSIQLLDGGLDQPSGTRVGQIMEGEGGLLGRELGAAVLPQIDFYKGIDGGVQFLYGLIGGDVAGIDTGLPMIEFDLVAKVEKEMNLIA